MAMPAFEASRSTDATAPPVPAATACCDSAATDVAAPADGDADAADAQVNADAANRDTAMDTDTERRRIESLSLDGVAVHHLQPFVSLL
jgi:hypothetical protein